jgi:putative membrane protein
MLRKLWTLLILTALVLTEPLLAIAQQTQVPSAPQPPQGYYGPGPWHMWGGGYGWPHWWMPIIFFLFFVFCMAMMFFMMGGRMMHRHRGDHALDLLNERFARGEISREEFLEKKRDILG